MTTTKDTPAPPPSGCLRAVVRRLVAMACGLAAALLLAELALRIVDPEIARRSDSDHRRFHFLAGNLDYADFYVSDPVLGWRNAPGTRRSFPRGELEYEYRINAFGMHSPETTREPAEGVFRIVLLGDSQAITQVSLELSHPWLLQNCLNERRAAGAPRYEVLNLGVAGYGFSQVLGMLDTALEFAPDLVLLQANPANDYKDEFPQFMDYLFGPHVRHVLGPDGLVEHEVELPELPGEEATALHEALYRLSAVYRVYNNTMVHDYYYNPDGFLHRSAARFGLSFSPPGLPVIDLGELKQILSKPDLELMRKPKERDSLNDETSELFASVDAILGQMQARTRAAGAEFAVFANPRVRRNQFITDPWLEHFTSGHGIPCLDVNSRARRYVERGQNTYEVMTFYPELDDAHYDARGNAIIAQMVCDWLLEAKLLTKRN